MKQSSNRIAFAYYLEGWNYENGNTSTLQSDGVKIVPSEYNPEMEGQIFCPVCFTNLYRVPKIKNYCTDGRESYFSHMRKYQNVKCDLRAKKSEGKRYESFEAAIQAIDDDKLVVIYQFMKTKPEISTETPQNQAEHTVEDQEGPLSDVPLGRFNGETFKLPSRIKTIKGLCRNFDQNLYKYFFIPGQQHAIRLFDLLHNVNTATEKDDTPRFYYGKIISTTHLGQYKRPANMRMTYFENNQYGVADFCLKISAGEQLAHGIDDESIGRYIIMYGKITDNGVGLCISNLGWGEFALLPEKYNRLLP